MFSHSSGRRGFVCRIAVAITLGSVAAFLGVLSFAAPSPKFVGGDRSTDLEPGSSRDFCGRIVIVFNGAGERESYESPHEAVDVNAAIKAFVLDSPVLVPSIIFSSDPAVIDGSRTHTLEKSGSAAIFPASKGAFEKALSSDGYLSLLKQRLASSSPCQKLMKQGQDVSRYIQIEIIIASHSSREQDRDRTFRGLPVWRNDSDHGTTKHALDQDLILTKEDFQPLYVHFPNAVFQTLVSTCDSANVGELIAPDTAAFTTMNGLNFCYAGLVDRNVIAPVRRDLKSPGAEHDELSVIASHLKFNSTDGAWNGAESLYQLNLSIFDYYRSNTRDLDRFKMIDSLFSLAPDTNNPFDVFAVTSLEGLFSQTSPEDGEVASGDDQGLPVTGLLKDIRSGLTKIAFIANRFIAHQLRLQDSFFKEREEMKDYFNNCFINITEPGCQNINVIVSRAKENGDSKPFDLFRQLAADISKFKDRTKYSFGGRNQKFESLDDMERTGFLAALSDIRGDWQNYRKFQELVFAYAVSYDSLDQVEPELKKLSERFSLFHQSFLHAYLPDLVKETIDKRLERIGNHVRTIVTRENDEESLPKLRIIRDQLQCLTAFPLGPAFDKKYILPKLASAEASKGKERKHSFLNHLGNMKGRNEATAPQRYLLPPLDSRLKR